MMFPFASTAGLSSAHRSSTSSILPQTQPSQTSQGDSSTTHQHGSCGANCGHGSYADKKAHWKCSLRQAHPFISREPNNWCREKGRTPSQDNMMQSSKISSKCSTFSMRHALLFLAMLLSIGILATGLAYSNLVNKPVTALAQDQPSNATVSGNLPVPENRNRSSSIRTSSTRSPTARISSTAVANTRQDRRQAASTGTRTSTSSVATITSTASQRVTASPTNRPVEENKEENEPAEEKYASVLAMFFYVAALPIVTIIHVFGEAIVAMIMARLSRNKSSTNQSPMIDDDDESFCDSDSETLHNEEKFTYELAYPLPPTAPKPRAPSNEHANRSGLKKAKKYVAIMSMIASALILVAWIIVGAFQLHCELGPVGNKIFCAYQIHLQRSVARNPTVRSLSITRSALSWSVVVVYLVFIVASLKQNKLLRFRMRRKTKSASSAKETPNEMPPPYSSPPGSILRRTGSSSSVGSSTSTRRKVVRFDLEESSRKQSERGDDVEYIPAPAGDGVIYGSVQRLSHYEQDTNGDIGYTYLGEHDATRDGTRPSYANATDVRTPWQWQGQFEDFGDAKQKEAGTADIETASTTSSETSTSTHTIARKPVPAPAYSKDKEVQDQLVADGLKEGVQLRGVSFDFGLASVKPKVPVMVEPVELESAKVVIENVSEKAFENLVPAAEKPADSVPASKTREFSTWSNSTASTAFVITPATALSSHGPTLLPATRYTPAPSERSNSVATISTIEEEAVSDTEGKDDAEQTKANKTRANNRLRRNSESNVTVSAILSDYGAGSRLGSIAEEI